MGKKKTDCPQCGNAQSYRAIVDGKVMRQCSACRHQFTISTKKAKAETEQESEE
jgi:uncharacterized protein (DUF983 family)